MLLWECTYKVNRDNDNFYVKDWVWSTTQPGAGSIGHYWNHLFDYTISECNSYLAAPGTDTDRAIIQDQPF